MNTFFTKLLSPFVALITFFSPVNVPTQQVTPAPSYRLDVEHIQKTVSDLDNIVGNIDVRLKYLENSATNLGASLSIPTTVALFETSLATKITSSATTMTLVSATDKAGTTLASSTYAFIIDEGSADEEMVLADCTGTACTNMTRGISPLTGTSTVSTLQHEHRRGASVKITDGPQLMILTRIINGIGTIPNILSYTSGTACTGASSNSTICDKAYIDGVAVAGASNANTTTKGIVEISTAIENASSTALGSTGATIVPSSSLSSSTPLRGCDGTATAGALCSVVAQNNGKIDPNYISTTSIYNFTGNNSFTGTQTFSGLNSFSATTTFATSTQTGLHFGGNIAQQYTGYETISGAASPKAVMMATTSTAAGRISMIESDVASTSAPLLGFAINNCSLGTTCYVQTDGIVKGFSGLTVGAQYYVSDTAGTISTTVGTSENYVGRAIASDQIEIDKNRSIQYLGSQSLTCSAAGVTVVNQPWARTVVIAGSVSDANGAGGSGDLSLSKIGKTTGTIRVGYIPAAPLVDDTLSASWSGGSITMSYSGSANSCTATAYYYK